MSGNGKEFIYRQILNRAIYIHMFNFIFMVFDKTQNIW